MGMIRPAAVAGMFYPDDPATLQQSVRGYFAEAPKAPDPGEQPVPKIIVAPHAGHVYSGLTAAYAYNRIAPARDTIKRVVIMGPCHRVPVRVRVRPMRCMGHDSPPPTSCPRMIRVTAMAAPKPLSMLTTVIPEAQPVNMPSRAATPPRALP